MEKICPIMATGTLANPNVKSYEVGHPCIKDKCALWVSVPSKQEVVNGYDKDIPDRSHCGLIKGSE